MMHYAIHTDYMRMVDQINLSTITMGRQGASGGVMVSKLD